MGRLKLNPLWENPAYRFKFFARSLILAPKTFDWVKKLEGYRYVDSFLSQQTNLPCKLQRPYLSTAFNSEQCLKALTYHYDFFDAKATGIVRAFYHNKRAEFAHIEGKNETSFYLTAKAEDRYAREGEITLFLEDGSRQTLAALTFSIILYNDLPTLFIAGLQGAEGDVESPREATQKATKACFGLFPKRLLLEVAYRFAHEFRVKQIIAVSNKTHIYNNWRYRKRLKLFVANYDEFWQSINAVQLKDGLFKLPDAIERKPIEEVASKKRSEYRQRYQLLDTLLSHISKTYHTLS